MEIRKTDAAPALLACAVAAAVGIPVLYGVAVRTVLGQAIDNRLMFAVAAALEGTAWTEVALELVSPGLVIGAAGLIACLALAHGGLRAAIAAGATLVVTIVGAQLLKLTLTRPTWLDGTANSLPSGHVAAVAGLAAALVLACPAVLRPLAAAGGVVAVALVGLATMALEWHRPSDVLAAALLAVGVGSIAAASGAVSRTISRRCRRSPLPAAP